MTDFPSLKENFKDVGLLDLALTHKSWVNEHPKIRQSNERLEFLGDAILEFVVSKEIFNKLPNKEEGYLTALRANLVNTVNLAKLAQTIDIGKNIFLSKGEEDGGGRKNASILANTIEAIIGALYLDGGIEKAEEFIQTNLLSDLQEKINQPLKDAKSRLQEYVQARGHATPKYEVVEEEGPDHDKRFTIQVVIDGKAWGVGVGKNKSEGAQEAAKQALTKVE
jgi:ribonuclease III